MFRFAVGVAAALLVVWIVPAAAGYGSIVGVWRDMTDPNYSKPFDRVDLSKDLVTDGFALGDPAFVRIFKQERRLELWLHASGEGHYRLFRTYEICSYSGHLGPKLQEGDHQAPEGFYEVSTLQLNPNSRHHLAFNIGFPNVYDLSHGRTGTFLMVHGGCSSVGCYAVTDEKVDEIYAIVEAALNEGQPSVPVHIFPFELTRTNLTDYAGHRWLSFWANLKEGYDLFEAERVPPSVAACNQQYVFGEDAKSETCTPVTGWR